MSRELEELQRQVDRLREELAQVPLHPSYSSSSGSTIEGLYTVLGGQLLTDAGREGVAHSAASIEFLSSEPPPPASLPLSSLPNGLGIGQSASNPSRLAYLLHDVTSGGVYAEIEAGSVVYAPQRIVLPWPSVSSPQGSVSAYRIAVVSA